MLKGACFLLGITDFLLPVESVIPVEVVEIIDGGNLKFKWLNGNGGSDNGPAAWFKLDEEGKCSLAPATPI